MKKLFSKRSGFTLVEIVIAFAIFAIMSAMILQMLNLAVNQRRSNKDFADDLAKQEELLAAGNKDTSGTFNKTGEIDLDFKDKDGKDSIKLGMDYQLKPADKDSEDAADGINYFVGDLNYGADGTGSSGGGGGGAGGAGGATQASRYDTRITGSKGLINIKINAEKLTASPIPTAPIPDDHTWYKFTVSADSSKMMTEDKQIAQFRIYFYSKDFDSVKQDDGKYKKVYKQAQMTELFYVSTEARDDTYQIEANSNSIRFSILKGKGANGFDTSHDITFYCLFKGDPQLDADSFGANSVGGVYNASPVYDETTGADTGKKHVNIYGSFPYEISSSSF